MGAVAQIGKRANQVANNRNWAWILVRLLARLNKLTMSKQDSAHSAPEDHDADNFKALN